MCAVYKLLLKDAHNLSYKWGISICAELARELSMTRSQLILSLRWWICCGIFSEKKLFRRLFPLKSDLLIDILFIDVGWVFLRLNVILTID